MADPTIFLPALWLMAITIVLFVFMYRVRVALVRSGEVKASEFRTYENEPPVSRKWSRAISNQFETPVIFYALCLIAFVTSSVDGIMLALAWAFVAVKTVHIYVHTSQNRLRYRQPIFALSLLILLLMLAWVAVKVLSA